MHKIENSLFLNHTENNRNKRSFYKNYFVYFFSLSLLLKYLREINNTLRELYSMRIYIVLHVNLI